MNLAEAALRGRLVVAILCACVLFGGWHAYRDLPRLEDPEFLIRTAVVATRYPGATAEEVAEEVTEALETAIQNLHEVEEIRSVSSIGSSVVNVDVGYEHSRSRAELDAVWTKLRDRVDDARPRLPPGASAPVVNDDFSDVYGLLYLVTGEGYTPRELHEYAKTLRTELLAVPGVGSGGSAVVAHGVCRATRSCDRSGGRMASWSRRRDLTAGRAARCPMRK